MPSSSDTVWSRREGNGATGAEGTELSEGRSPNELWCADYKGQFLTGQPSVLLPARHHRLPHRYLLACEALESTKERFAFTIFERVFKEFGLPAAIRTDNGVPFSSPTLVRQ